ncbi:MAG: hypothetical protein GPJ50_00745 [Candidatus Heimdallarchaeota archaeon]|nr:hypothetical protein [Candidatus Heimdallarchaeota archaeon]
MLDIDNMNWKSRLETLEDMYQNLSSESLQLLGEYRDSDENTSSENFYIDANSHGLYQYFSKIDLRKHFGLSGNICFYAMDDLFPGLLYYDTIFTFLFPVERKYFDYVHCVKYSELNKLIELQSNKRIIFLLSSNPLEYEPYDYLEPLFELGTTKFIPLRPNVTSLFKESDLEADKLSESISEIPHIRAAIQRKANEGHEKYEQTEFAIKHALQDLHYRGMFDLKNFLWNILFKEPEIGVEVVFSLRRLLINPIDTDLQMPNCRSLESTVSDLWKVGRQLKVKNLSFPGEIGALLSTNLSFPSPRSWDGLDWCENNIDIKRLRKAFKILEGDIISEIDDDPDKLDSFKSIIKEIWSAKLREISRLQSLVYWGTTLSVGAAGTIITGPLVGLLGALGITALSNMLLGPFSKEVSRVLRSNSFHLWDFDRTKGR